MSKVLIYNIFRQIQEMNLPLNEVQLKEMQEIMQQAINQAACLEYNHNGG